MTRSASADIAIVGMSCLFPGAGSLRAFWQNVFDRFDAVTDPPDDWIFQYGYDPESAENDRIYCARGGYLNELAQFNPLEYGVVPSAVDGADPEQFLALRVAHETLEDAGYLNKPFNRKSTAVIVGRGSFPNRGLGAGIQHGLIADQTVRILKQLHPEYTDDELQTIKRELKRSVPPFNAETVTGTVSNILTGRIANRLDLQGPNYGVDAACAASILAVDHGMRELQSGRCDMVIAGGVSVFSSAALNLVFSRLNAVSRSAEIRPFDERADGTLVGSGLGMVLLKRLEDAERDGDRIYSVIKGIGIASDGRAAGLLAPRIEGEELAIRRAYEATGISPTSIDLVEAHGTGTPVGDAAEIESLTRVFGLREGERPTVALGTVKSMISHLIPAAGIAGLIKTSLALYHKVLPPTLHCERPNPELGLEKTPFYLNTQTRPWISAGSKPRRAGINSFGFGGINTHTILEEYTGADEQSSPTFAQRWDSEVFIIQGPDRDALVAAGRKLADFLQTGPNVTAKDLAYTLNCPLESGGRRLSIIAATLEELLEKLQYALGRVGDPQTRRIQDRKGIYYFEDAVGEGKLAFLFPGEGCQYPNLLADLCMHFPEVRACFDRGNRVWSEAWSHLLPSDVFFPIPSPDPNDPPQVDERMYDLDVATAAVYMANYAMFLLLSRLGIEPDYMAGHSSGELTALFASDAIVDQDEDEVVSYCLELLNTGRSLTDQVPIATLMTVGISDRGAVDRLVEASDGEITIAIDNCPHQVILCGSEEAMQAARQQLQSSGGLCTVLPFNRAYHTASYQPVSDEFYRLLEKREFAAPSIPVYSCATAQPYPSDPTQIRRWAADQWAQPVRFQQTVEALYEDGARLFVEVGPRAILSGFVEDILQDKSFVAVPSNVHFRSGTLQLNHLVGMLAAHGVRFDPSYLYERREPVRVNIGGSDAGEATPGKPRMKPMVLELEIPQFSLKDPEPLRHVSTDGTQPAVSAPGPQTNHDAPPSVAATAATNGHAGNQVDPPVPMTTPAASAAPANPASQEGATGQKAQVMQHYLASMEQFLASQQQVVASYLERVGKTKSSDENN